MGHSHSHSHGDYAHHEGSIALAGFGSDSVIEVTSGGAALWRLGRDSDEAKRAAAERRSLRIIGTGCSISVIAGPRTQRSRG